MISLNDLVVRALRKLPEYFESNIWTIDNHQKYSTIDKQPDELGKQEQIFKLMYALNVQGICQSDTCADSDGNGSLNELVNTLGEKIAILTKGKRVHYIELGPEPVKTSELIKHLKDSAEDLIYTAIDINQTSEPFMRDELVPLLKSADHFRFLARNYHHVDRTELECGQDITLITMLGFQEGNELPPKIGQLINQLGGMSTYIISEVQIYKLDNQDHIYEFYQNDNMIEFSKLVCIEQGGVPFGNHLIEIVPVHMDGQILHVAVTLQLSNKDDDIGYLVTNICIKFTQHQFSHIRETYADCEVIGEFISGDRSVSFQLAQFNSKSL